MTALVPETAAFTHKDGRIGSAVLAPLLVNLETGELVFSTGERLIHTRIKLTAIAGSPLDKEDLK